MSEMREPRRSLESIISREKLERLADSAEQFLKTLVPPNHLYAAMKEFQNDSPDLQQEVRAKITQILKQRKATTKKVAPMPNMKLVEKPVLVVDPDMIKDSFGHEKRQPLDTYDAEAEEEARKPLKPESAK